MKIPTTPNLARYFSKCGLTLHCSIEFDIDGRRTIYWGLSQAENGKPFWTGERKVFSSTCDLWRAWHAYQLRLHLQHAQAVRFVRYFLRHEQKYSEPFNAWLDHNAVAKSARADDVDTTRYWPWTSAQTSLDRRDRLQVYGHPWTDAPTVTVIRRCTRKSESKGWARRAIRVAAFDRQSATRCTDAIRDLVQDERRRRFASMMKRAGGKRPSTPRKRL